MAAKPINLIVNGPGSVGDRFRAVALEIHRRKLRYIFGYEVKMGDLWPKAFDCSEFVQWLFWWFGYSIVDGSFNQWHLTRALTASEKPRIGDLFFMRKRVLTTKGWAWKVYHVGVCIGNGQWMEFRGRLYGSVVMDTAGILKRGGILRRPVKDSKGKAIVIAPITTTPQPPAPTMPKPVKLGSRGGIVLTIQRKLACRPYDGVFGQKTDSAVRAFERDKKLTADGVVDQSLYAKILARPEIVQAGSPKAWVRVVQRAVAAKQDGIWGPETLAAVKAFQRRNGLRADGIVGPDTWGKIEEA